RRGGQRSPRCWAAAWSSAEPAAPERPPPSRADGVANLREDCVIVVRDDGCPGDRGVGVELASHVYLLSLLRGGVSRRVIVARTPLRRQVRGLHSLFANIITRSRIAQNQAAPRGSTSA